MLFFQVYDTGFSVRSDGDSHMQRSMPAANGDLRISFSFDETLVCILVIDLALHPVVTRFCH